MQGNNDYTHAIELVKIINWILIDVVRNWEIWEKYRLIVIIVGVSFGYIKPKHSHSLEEIQQHSTNLDKSIELQLA